MRFVWLKRAMLALGAGYAAATASVAQEAWPTTDVPALTHGKPRILLIHDMEGLAGQGDPYSFLYGHPKYSQGQQLLAADVNAVVDGLFAGGAGSVTVVDGHGSGNPDADLPVERLDPRAQRISRPRWFDAYLDLAEGGEFDAVAVVGMHAKSGSGGFASHTYTIGVQISIDGRSITETELVGLLYGRAGIPVIFASGDDRLARDLRTMPWLRYVETKKATSASTAELYPVDEVHATMRRQARLAVRRLGEARVVSMPGPMRVAVRAVPPANMKWLEGMPGVEYSDDTVSFTAANVVAAYRGMGPIVNALAVSFSDAELSAFDAQPDAELKRRQGMEELYRRWFEAESGVSPRAATPAATAEAQRSYHGFN